MSPIRTAVFAVAFASLTSLTACQTPSKPEAVTPPEEEPAASKPNSSEEVLPGQPPAEAEESGEADVEPRPEQTVSEGEPDPEVVEDAPAEPESAPGLKPAHEVKGPADLPAGVTAMVNGHPILQSEVEEQVRARTPPGVFESPGAAQMLDHYRHRMRELLIDKHLIEEEIEKQGIEMTDEEMARDMDEELRAFLSDNDMTRDQFEQRLRGTRGQSIEQFLAARAQDPKLRRMRTEAKLIETRFHDEIQVSEDEIKSFHEEYREKRYTKPAEVRASHVLIGTKGMTGEQKATAREKAEKLAAQAKTDGADFAALAKEHSTCPSKARGGDLGFFPRTGKMVEAFAEAAFALEIGQISGVIESEFGYHIIKATDRKEPQTISLARAHDGIHLLLKARKIQQVRKRYADQLRAAADIVLAPGLEPLDAQPAPPTPPPDGPSE